MRLLFHYFSRVNFHLSACRNVRYVPFARDPSKIALFTSGKRSKNPFIALIVCGLRPVCLSWENVLCIRNICFHSITKMN